MYLSAWSTFERNDLRLAIWLLSSCIEHFVMTLALLLKAVERDYNGCYGNDYNADDDSYQEACVTTVVVITTCCVISD